MALTQFPLQVVLSLLDRLTPGLGKAEGKVTAFGRGISRVGKRLTLGLTAPTLLAGAGVIRTALSFDEAMNNIQAVTQTTEKTAIQPLRDQAAKLGRDLKFTGTEVAQGMAQMAKAGVPIPGILSEIEHALQLAAATGTDAAFTIDRLTDILKGYGRELDPTKEGFRSTQTEADILTAATVAVTQEFSDLAEAFVKAGPQAKLMGVRFSETAATLSALADAGLKAERGGTAVSAFLIDLIQETPKLITLLDELGVKRSDFFEGKQFLGLANMVDTLTEAFDRNGRSQQDIFKIFEARGARGLGALFTGGGGARIRSLEEQITREGVAAATAEIQLQGAVGSVARFKAAIGELAIAIADSGLLDQFSRIVDRLTSWLRSLAESDQKLLAMGTTIATVGALLGPALIALGTTVATLGSSKIVAGVTLLVTGMIAAAEVFQDIRRKWDPNRSIFENLFFKGGAGVPLEQPVGAQRYADLNALLSRSAALNSGTFQSPTVEPFRQLGRSLLDASGLSGLSRVEIKVDAPAGTEARVLPGGDVPVDLDVGVVGGDR